MLLVVIAALLTYIVVLWQRERQARLEAELMRAKTAYERARAGAILLQMQTTGRRAGRGIAGEETKGE
jgi:hypothetical protein